MEVDFPRGGAKPKPHKIAETESGPQKRKITNTEKSVPEKRKRQKEDTENEAKVFDKYIKYDMLIEDVRGIGAVSKIEDDSITLQTINGIRIKVPAKSISRIYQKTFSQTSATLDDLFKIGQMLAFRVECSKGDKSKDIIASTCPSRVNDCLNASTLLNGIVCNATVKSIEEKGVVMDLGFGANLQGFAPTEVLPDVKTLIIGQVLLVRIIREKNDSQRFIKVSAYPEMDTFEDEKMTLNHLMPGTVLHAEPASIKDDGVLVSFKNGLQAFVSREELPPRVRGDLSKLVRGFRVVVVLCRQNSPFLVVSGHPDVVALSKFERRFIPAELSIGSIFEGEVYAVDKNNNVFFNIRENDGDKVSLVTAKLMAKNMENSEKIAMYRIGSTHKLRILKYSLFERSLFVTNKKELMNKAVEVSEEFQPGQRVTFTVKVIADTGLRGTIGLSTRATVIVHHTLDLPIASWQKAFKEGQKVKCRILYKHADKHIYYLTAKPALVNSNDEIITEYSKENVGKFTSGLCAKMLDSGAIISFYNRVKAFLPLSEVKKIAGLKEGMVVRGRILMVDSEKEKMTIVIGEKTAVDPSTGKKKKDKKSKAVKNLGIYTAKVTGPWKFGGTSEDTSLLVELPDDNVGRLHVSELGKYTSIKTFLKEFKNKPLNIRVIEVSKITQLPKAMREKLANEKHVKRFYECTFDPKKLNDPKKKQKLLHYKIDFSVGDSVNAFLVESSASKFQKAEVNPIFKAQINPESDKCVMNDFPDENGITRATPIISGKGELRKGKITGINRSKKCKSFINFN
jgi:rRNA biogenesis protein RRP5